MKKSKAGRQMERKREKENGGVGLTKLTIDCFGKEIIKFLLSRKIKRITYLFRCNSSPNECLKLTF